jgi:hypothetical protein
MAVERYTVGKNAYNKRERISVGMGAEDADAMRDALAELARSPKTPEARLEPAVQWAKATLERKGMPLDPNAWCYAEKAWRLKNERCSAEWYAVKILHNADWLRLMIERGEARMAADFALDLGELITEAHFILEAFAGPPHKGGKKKAENALRGVESRIAECRRQAAEKWNQRPDRTASEIARYIKVMGPKGTPLAPGYIRKKIADLAPKKR